MLPDTQDPDPVHPWPPHWAYFAMFPAGGADVVGTVVEVVLVEVEVVEVEVRVDEDPLPLPAPPV